MFGPNIIILRKNVGKVVRDGTSACMLLVGCVGIGIIYAIWKWKYYKSDDDDDPIAPEPELFIRQPNIKFGHLYHCKEIVTNSAKCDQVIQELKRRSYFNSAIGFDCEFKPTFARNKKRNPVALIQLASSDGFCGLFRLSQMKTVPDSLKELLESECIYKVGVATITDAIYLREDYGINMRSALDLRHVAKMCDYKPRGLAFLSKKILNFTMDKNKFITCSNWEAEELTDRQVMYAATDAQVSVKIFDQLMAKLGSKFTESDVKRICDFFKNKDFKY